MNFYSFKSYLFAIILASLSCYSLAMPFEMPLGAQLEHTLSSEGSVHQVVLSAPKRINNALVIEKESLLKGIKTGYLYRINEPASSKQVFDQLMSQAKALGTIEFSCSERACGSSNYWANTILEERMLYGRDNDQYYFVSKVLVNGQPHWQVVYAVMNGRKRHYVYIAVVEEEVEKFVWKNGLEVTSAQIDEDVQRYIKAYLVQNPSHQLWLVAAIKSRAGDSFDMLKQRSDKGVVDFKQALVKQAGFSEKQVKIFSAGAFSLDEAADSSQINYRLFLLAP